MTLEVCSHFLVLFIITLLSANLVNTDSTPAQDEVQTHWKFTWTDLLRRDLLLDYDKFARPAQHTNATTVDFSLTVKRLQLDDITSVLTVNAWCCMTWLDEKLKWNESEYGGLKLLQMGSQEIWQPDIALYNSAEGLSDHYGDVLSLVSPVGQVVWSPPAQLSVFCDQSGLPSWPFDTQICRLDMASWAYDADQIVLRPKDVKIEIQSSSGWIVKGLETERRTVEMTNNGELKLYHHLNFWFTIKRHSGFFHAVVLVPASMILLLTLCVTWMPLNSSEKFLITGLNLIFTSYFLVYFTHELPMVAMRIPLIVLFYGCSLLLATVSLIVSSVTHNLSRVPQSRPVPSTLNRLFSGRLGRVLVLPSSKNVQKESSDQNSCEQPKPQQPISEPLNNWNLFAVALDRLMFLVFILVFVGMIINEQL